MCVTVSVFVSVSVYMCLSVYVSVPLCIVCLCVYLCMSMSSSINIDGGYEGTPTFECAWARLTIPQAYSLCAVSLGRYTDIHTTCTHEQARK